ncbi:peptide ABC transporter substrate-binding protein [Treponema phagedenis]|uniref:peptide ABC transporter substrate-binding protein n=1 Tax=Treponema phagedenis TaxID=162 RepID=UPI00197E43A1|nr:peptide ABC transporter substrate-binding protein [Treponema phagedenis]QSH93681.1 peptide ABC transporter substrate-binding protein [Treponema phagedenis]
MKKILLVLGAFVSVALLCAGCGGKAEAGAANDSDAEFIICNGAEPQSLDPAKVTGVPEHRINMALFEGLVAIDPQTGGAIPGVAKNWDVSEDKTVYTFHLRDVVWSDGTPITAQTVVDSWLRTLAPETASEYAYMVSMVVKGAEDYNTGKAPASAVAIRAVDEKTFEVTLNGPIPYVLDVMTHYAFNIFPMHAIKKFGADWIKPGNFVGNGPFVLESWVPQEKLTVVPNDKFWNKDDVHLSRIVFLPIEDNNTAYEKYRAGEIDWNTAPPLSLLEEVKLLPDYKVAPQVATYYYAFNVSKGPLKDVKVRKALTMALNRQELVDKVTKGGELAARSISPALSGYTPAEGAGYDPEQAKKLLAEAGYPEGKGFPTLTIIYNTQDKHKVIAEYIQEAWKKTLGVNIAIQNYEWKTYLDVRHQHDFEISRAGWVGDYQDPNTFLELFITDGGNNDGLYSNPKYDELLRKAATMEGGPERMQVMHDAEQILMDDQAVLPMYFYVSQNLIDTEKWSGWYVNAPDQHPYVGMKKVK